MQRLCDKRELGDSKDELEEGQGLQNTEQEIEIKPDY